MCLLYIRTLAISKILCCSLTKYMSSIDEIAFPNKKIPTAIPNKVGEKAAIMQMEMASVTTLEDEAIQDVMKRFLC